MRNFVRPVAAIVWRDIVLETRSKDIVISLLVFSLLVVVVFNFAIEITPHTAALVAPGVLWVAISFGGLLGLTRSIALEMESGGLDGLLLAPVGRDAVFFGKVVSNTLFMLVVEVFVFPVFAVMFDVSIAEPGLLPIAVLATLGTATVGTVFAAMAANTRAREVMLPLLFLPAALPAIVAAVEATGLLLGDGTFRETGRWIALLAAFDAAFLVVAPLAFRLVIED